MNIIKGFEINNYCFQKTNAYFRRISKEAHDEVLGNNSFEYISAEPDFIFHALNKIKEIDNKFNNYKFLDVGSGIGHICGIANLFNLNSVGIEYNKKLYEISKIIYPEICFNYININEFKNYDKFDIIYYYLPL